MRKVFYEDSFINSVLKKSHPSPKALKYEELY